MTIGTSLGNHYQDEHHYQARDFQSDIQKSVDKAVKGITWEDDPDIIRNPMEMSIDNPARITTPDQLMSQKYIGSDPGNIYNDSGDIVDYKEGGQWGTPDLPTRPIHINPLDRMEEFNEIDALADRKTDEQIRKEAEEMNK